MQPYFNEVAPNHLSENFCSRCGGSMSHSIHLLTPDTGVAMTVLWDSCTVCRDWINAKIRLQRIDGKPLQWRNEFDHLKPKPKTPLNRLNKPRSAN